MARQVSVRRQLKATPIRARRARRAVPSLQRQRPACMGVVDGQPMLMYWKSNEQQKPFTLPVTIEDTKLEYGELLFYVTAPPSGQAPDGVAQWVPDCGVPSKTLNPGSLKGCIDWMKKTCGTYHSPWTETYKKCVITGIGGCIKTEGPFADGDVPSPGTIGVARVPARAPVSRRVRNDVFDNPVLSAAASGVRVPGMPKSQRRAARTAVRGGRVPQRPVMECPESGIICVHPWLCYECTPTA